MKKKPTYRVVLFYARAHQPEFNTKQEALNYIKARALTKRAACYTELWEMTTEDDGQMEMLFDYGSTEPLQLVNPKVRNKESDASQSIYSFAKRK